MKSREVKKKVVIVEFADYGIWEIPAERIAAIAAEEKVCSEAKSPEDAERIRKEEYEYAMENDWFLKDYAENNIEWGQIKDVITQRSFARRSSMVEQFYNAEFDVDDVVKTVYEDEEDYLGSFGDKE